MCYKDVAVFFNVEGDIKDETDYVTAGFLRTNA